MTVSVLKGSTASLMVQNTNLKMLITFLMIPFSSLMMPIKQSQNVFYLIRYVLREFTEGCRYILGNLFTILFLLLRQVIKRFAHEKIIIDDGHDSISH